MEAPPNDVINKILEVCHERLVASYDEHIFVKEGLNYIKTFINDTNKTEEE